MLNFRRESWWDGEMSSEMLAGFVVVAVVGLVAEEAAVVRPSKGICEREREKLILPVACNCALAALVIVLMMLQLIAKRWKSRISAEISPRIVDNLNSSFNLKFTSEVSEASADCNSTINTVASSTCTSNSTISNSLTLPQSQIATLIHQQPRSFIQPGRTYREELYASRRIELTPTQAVPSAFRKLSQRLQEEQVLQRVKERRYFVRPGLVKHAMMYAGRRNKFNQMVRDTINRIVQYKESQKQ